MLPVTQYDCVSSALEQFLIYFSINNTLGTVNDLLWSRNSVIGPIIYVNSGLMYEMHNDLDSWDY